MGKLTYQQAYDKIIDAYFKNEIRPYEPRFCFCGTLNNNEGEWFNSKLERSGIYYTHKELKKMEMPFLMTIDYFTLNEGKKIPSSVDNSFSIMIHHNYENALFEGMCRALEVLKQIHISRGETIDGNIGFKKRELSKV